MELTRNLNRMCFRKSGNHQIQFVGTLCSQVYFTALLITRYLQVHIKDIDFWSELRQKAKSLNF